MYSLSRHERLLQFPDFIVSSIKECKCSVNDNEVVWLYQIQVPEYFFHVLPVAIDDNSLKTMILKNKVEWQKTADDLIKSLGLE